ncbi:hypothetical protein FACS1894195_1540 [Bacteroidia bacterium]|nr:hypothetical protein FACS1894195_1540 [Bacteroidia bacterium]
MSVVVAGSIAACKDDETPVKPTVTNVSPTAVDVGDTITITGTNLDKAGAVAFGTTADNFRSVPYTQFVSTSGTSIKVIVPADVIFPSGVAILVGIDPIAWVGGMLTAKTAGQAQQDAVAFLLCSNKAYTDAGNKDNTPEYAAAYGVCLQTHFVGKDLSFDNTGKPNNEYTIVLYTAIEQMVTANYVGQPAEVIAASIAGIQGSIYQFYQGLQGAQ